MNLSHSYDLGRFMSENKIIMPGEIRKKLETRRIGRLFLLAFVLNLILAGVKSVLAINSDSFAVTAGAIDSVTDSVASLAVYVGILLSSRTLKSFPLGLYKLENFLSIVIALFIFITGYEVAKRIFLVKENVTSISLTTIFLLVTTTAGIFIFGQYASSVGKQTGSPTLKAEGKHRQADVFANLLVLLAVLLDYLGFRHSGFGLNIDQLAALFVLLFVVYTGWDLLSDSMRVLLDASIDHETLNKIRNIILQEPSVVEISSLMGRNAGRFLFIQMNIILRTKDLEKAHAVSNYLEQKIIEMIPNVEHIIIHYEPLSPDSLCTAFPLKDKHGSLSEHFGSAPYFAFVYYDLQEHKVRKKEVLSNPYQDIECGKGLRVAEWLASLNANQIICKKIMKYKGPEYALKSVGIMIKQTDVTSLEQITLSQLRS